MFPKPTQAFLILSLAVHAFFAAALYYPTFVQQVEEQNAVQIDYIQLQSVPEKAPPRHFMPPKKAPVVSKPAAPPKKIQLKSKQRPVQQPVSLPKPTLKLERSEDLLADPEKGKIFAVYFAKIKHKIQNRVQRKYSYEDMGAGTVTLLFVLDSDGSLDSVSVLEKQSTGGSDVKSFAMRCVRDSAPFGRFPSDLNLGKVSFNITVLFEEI